MNKLKLSFYLAVTLAGLLWPWYYIYQFINETKQNGLTDIVSIVNFFSHGVWANASAGFIASDLTLVLILSFVFIFIEGRRLKMRYYIYYPLTFTISFAFSFGLFMFNRERQILKLNG
tara:strand:- start:58 stop:411 length:354 start_codon:yes stop_codon:yes gene_type:complete